MDTLRTNRGDTLHSAFMEAFIRCMSESIEYIL